MSGLRLVGVATLLFFTFAAQAELPADCREQAAVAEQFANEYIAWLQSDSAANSSTLRWLLTNKQASEALVEAYQTQAQAAWQADPELGPAADLLLDAQDFPDDGFVAASCDTTSLQVALRGKTWTDFTLALRLIKQGTAWLVDGMGAVNVAPVP